MKKLIMHYDMDAFYASVEIRDNPKLQGKPVIVGTRVVTTCNYEARKYGLHSAMSVKEAKKLCPKGIYLDCDKEKYYEISKTIQSLILKLSHDVEFIALDEGYIDISLLYEKYKDLDYIAKKFRERIYKHVKLTCSVGIGYNKLSAKIASEVNKPNGFFIIHDEEEFKNYVKDKNIRIIPGIGKKTQEILGKYGIETIKDIQNYSLLALQGILGHAKGIQLYENSLGIDNRKIEFERKNKSIGNETTLTVPVKNEILIKENLKNLFDGVFKRLKDSKYFSKTLTIKYVFQIEKLFKNQKVLEIIQKIT